MTNDTITAIDGLRVGHAHELDGPTGCTVILCPPGTVGGVAERGGAPGTRETDLLRPGHLVQHVDALLLAGGSAFGLDAATGVMRYLAEQGIGFETPGGRVPIVPAAILFDLDVNNGAIRPDAAMGYAACVAASDAPVVEGCVGAGAGARVGTLLGPEHACKSGVGSALIEAGDGVWVGALIAVNAVGDVLDEDGAILAGARRPDGAGFADSMAVLRTAIRFDPDAGAGGTVIGVVATNARLTKEGANVVAGMAHDGLARAVRPTHMLFDGDTIFTLATGQAGRANVSVVGALAAEVTAAAIRRAVRAATPLAGLPAIGAE